MKFYRNFALGYTKRDLIRVSFCNENITENIYFVVKSTCNPLDLQRFSRKILSKQDVKNQGRDVWGFEESLGISSNNNNHFLCTAMYYP